MSNLASALVDHELSTGGAGALGTVYAKTFEQLAPVIGARGVHSIFARALERVRSGHPELASFVLGDEPDMVAFEIPPALPRKTAVALYSAFFDLIVAFVGVELTLRLLHVAWPELALDAAQA